MAVGDPGQEVQARALQREQGLGLRWQSSRRGQAGTWRALTGKRAGLLGGHLPGLAEVTFVTDEHDDDGGLGVVVELLQPALHHLISLVLG